MSVCIRSMRGGKYIYIGSGILTLVEVLAAVPAVTVVFSDTESPAALVDFFPAADGAVFFLELPAMTTLWGLSALPPLYLQAG